MICNLGPVSINMLSNALLNCAEDTLENLNLRWKDFSDMDLDELILALSRSRNLTRLSLNGDRIGIKGCTSPAKLLRNHESNLQYLYLGRNSIDDDSAIILADSLAKNTKLRSLPLHVVGKKWYHHLWVVGPSETCL